MSYNFSYVNIYKNFIWLKLYLNFILKNSIKIKLTFEIKLYFIFLFNTRFLICLILKDLYKFIVKNWKKMISKTIPES